LLAGRSWEASWAEVWRSSFLTFELIEPGLAVPPVDSLLLWHFWRFLYSVTPSGGLLARLS
jgi:hypothetical protein